MPVERAPEILHQWVRIWLPVDRENEHGGWRAAYEPHELKTVALSTVIKNLETVEPFTVDVCSRS